MPDLFAFLLAGAAFVVGFTSVWWVDDTEWDSND